MSLATKPLANPSHQETKVIADAEHFITTLESNPAFQTDVAVLLTALPSSLLAEAASNPDALLQNLAASPSDLPAYVSAIPTSVVQSLETLAAKPIKAVEDVGDYIESLVVEPGVSSALSVLMTAVPTSVQNAFESDPVSFVENLVTATALPSWVTNIPAPLQSDIGSVINKGLSIIAADLEATGVPTVPTAASGFSPTVVVKPTGTGSVQGVNGTKPSGSPIPFVGAAAPMRTAAARVAALVAGAGVWLNL